MMFSGLREAVLSGVKYELIKIRKPVSLSRVNSTSFHSIPATSENRNNKHSTSSDLLRDKSMLTMKLPVIYNNELYQSRPNLGKCLSTKVCHSFSTVRHYSSFTKIQSHNYNEIPMPKPNDDHGDVKASLLHNRAAAIFRNYKRTFLRPSLDSRQLGSVSLLDIKKFLRQKMIDIKETHACICLSIPKHILCFDPSKSENKPDTRWKNVESELCTIYINKTTGGYVCPELALAGEWIQLQSFLTAMSKYRNSKKGEENIDIPALDSIDFESCERVEKIWNSAKPVESMDVTEFKTMLKYFKLPIRDGPNPEDFALHEVRILDLNQHRLSRPSEPDESESHDKSSINYELLFPVRYPGKKEIISLKRVYFCKESKTVMEENIPSEFDRYRKGSDENMSRLLPFPYGLDSATKSKATSVIIVNSALDALLLRTANNRSTSVVAFAEGNSLPPEHIPFFEAFSNLIFWFPDTASSTDDVTVFSRKLGDKRCFTMPRDYPQPSYYIRKPASSRPGGTDLIQAIKQNKRACSHEHITTFDTLREDVFLELAHFVETEGTKWKRFDRLNELVKGFRRGELTVFTGRTGSGKTTFMSEYSLDMCMQGVNTLWGSFEVRNVRLAKMQLKQFSEINLEEHIEQFDQWADKFSKLPMYYLTFHGAEEVDKVLDAMGYAVYVYDIGHVIIDNLQFMMGSNLKTLDRYYAQDMIIGKFRKFASLHNIHLTLVIHPRKEDEPILTTNSIFGGAKATQEADNVILLQEEPIDERIKKKYLQIAKNRYSGDLGIVPLYFNKGTTTFSKKIYDREKKQAKEKKQTTTKLKMINETSSTNLNQHEIISDSSHS